MYMMQERMLLRPICQQDRGIYTSDLINPIDHQSTSNDWLKPVLINGLFNTHIDRLFANFAWLHPRASFVSWNSLLSVAKINLCLFHGKKYGLLNSA